MTGKELARIGMMTGLSLMVTPGGQDIPLGLAMMAGVRAVLLVSAGALVIVTMAWGPRIAFFALPDVAVAITCAVMTGFGVTRSWWLLLLTLPVRVLGESLVGLVLVVDWDYAVTLGVAETLTHIPHMVLVVILIRALQQAGLMDSTHGTITRRETHG